MPANELALLPIMNAMPITAEYCGRAEENQASEVGNGRDDAIDALVRQFSQPGHAIAPEDAQVVTLCIAVCWLTVSVLASLNPHPPPDFAQNRAPPMWEKSSQLDLYRRVRCINGLRQRHVFAQRGARTVREFPSQQILELAVLGGVPDFQQAATSVDISFGEVGLVLISTLEDILHVADKRTDIERGRNDVWASFLRFALESKLRPQFRLRG
jgi:hypothetical protein